MLLFFVNSAENGKAQRTNTAQAANGERAAVPARGDILSAWAAAPPFTFLCDEDDKESAISERVRIGLI